MSTIIAAGGGRGGAVVSVSSAAAPSAAPASSSTTRPRRAPLDPFTVGLGRGVADEGIRVNAVRPGLTETDIHASTGTPTAPPASPPRCR